MDPFQEEPNCHLIWKFLQCFAFRIWDFKCKLFWLICKQHFSHLTMNKYSAIHLNLRYAHSYIDNYIWDQHLWWENNSSDVYFLRHDIFFLVLLLRKVTWEKGGGKNLPRAAFELSWRLVFCEITNNTFHNVATPLAPVQKKKNRFIVDLWLTNHYKKRMFQIYFTKQQEGNRCSACYLVIKR